MADNPRFRVLCFQPDFRFETEPLRVSIGSPTVALTGSGGLSPLRFTVREGTLPRGLVLDAETGLISGTAAGPAGEYRVSVDVQTAVGRVAGVRRIILEPRSSARPDSP
jgi:hypothetical protein